MATKKPTKKALAEAGAVEASSPDGESSTEAKRSEKALLEWRLAALRLEAQNLRFEDSESFSHDERLAIIERGAAAIGAYVDQIKREIHSPLPEDEIHSNYLAMKNLHLVVRDGFVALCWLARDMTSDAQLDAKVRSDLAKLAVSVKLNNDPKHAEMQGKIRDEWLLWQAGKVNYKSDADFARKMIEKAIHIESEGSIKNAITVWRKKSSS